MTRSADIVDISVRPKSEELGGGGGVFFSTAGTIRVLRGQKRRSQGGRGQELMLWLLEIVCLFVCFFEIEIEISDDAC